MPLPPLLFLLSLGTAAHAADFYVEGPQLDDKADATALETTATSAGQSGRVVRRFVDGEGWRFVLRVEGFADEAAATLAATTLAQAASVTFDVFESDGKAAARVASIGADAAPPPPQPPEDDDTDAGPALQQAVAAHGVELETLTALHTGPTVLEFRRSMANGWVADHIWATEGGATYVEVKRVEGEVTASRTLWTDEGAWLSVDGGDWQTQDSAKTKRTIDQLAPESVVPMVLSLGAAVATKRAFERMHVAGRGEIGGDVTDVLRFDGDQASGPMVLHTGAKDHLLRSVSFSDGEVVHEFGDYARKQGIQLPHEVVTTRGGASSDTVVVTRFEQGVALPDAWFQRP